MSALPQPQPEPRWRRAQGHDRDGAGAGSLGDFDVTPELDRQLDALARRARLDPAARDTLYRALAFKIDRFVQRHCRRYHLPGRVVEPSDVAQEAYLVFCELINRWPGQRSFAGYFFHVFPWRLASAATRQEWGSRAEPVIESLDEQQLEAPEGVLALIEAGAGLRQLDRAVLELRLDYGMTVAEVAASLGVTERTVFRSWARIRRDLGAPRYTTASSGAGERPEDRRREEKRG